MGRRQKPFHLLICPNAFKGTLSPTQAARAIQKGVKRAQRSWKTTLFPIADGGDGTLDALLASWKAQKRRARVTGPLGKKVTAQWGFCPRKGKRKSRAAIEMAQASGLALVKGKNRILRASTFGTGELILRALNAGAQEIYVGVGGTATGEGGAGALAALGARFLDKEGRLLRPIPQDLLRLDKIDLSELDSRLKKTQIIVLVDVKNPLHGPNGSARVFGPQKGANPSEVAVLEKVLKKLDRNAPRRRAKNPGAGAAGALAWGLSAFLGAHLEPGAPQILKLLNFSKAASGVDGLVTGEGKIDKTSFSGKAVGILASKVRKKPLWAIVGSSALSPASLRKRGFRRVAHMGLDGLRRPSRALEREAQNLFSRDF